MNYFSKWVKKGAKKGAKTGFVLGSFGLVVPLFLSKQAINKEIETYNKALIMKTEQEQIPPLKELAKEKFFEKELQELKKKHNKTLKVLFIVSLITLIFIPTLIGMLLGAAIGGFGGAVSYPFVSLCHKSKNRKAVEQGNVPVLSKNQFTPVNTTTLIAELGGPGVGRSGAVPTVVATPAYSLPPLSDFNSAPIPSLGPVYKN